MTRKRTSNEDGRSKKAERTLIISIHVGCDGALFAAGFLAVALVDPFFAVDIADDADDDGGDVDGRAEAVKSGADEGGDGIALNGDGSRSKSGA
jgi:hypothetical protein